MQHLQGPCVSNNDPPVHLVLLLLLQAQKRFDVQIQVIPETADGDIDVEALQNMLAQQVRAPHLQRFCRV